MRSLAISSILIRKRKASHYLMPSGEPVWSHPEGHYDDEPDVYRLGKKRAGRLLDGIEHNGMPDHG